MGEKVTTEGLSLFLSLERNLDHPNLLQIPSLSRGIRGAVP
jgi:hypothetical protein